MINWTVKDGMKMKLSNLEIDGLKARHTEASCKAAYWKGITQGVLWTTTIWVVGYVIVISLQM